MSWVWQLANWPNFSYNSNILKEREAKFWQESGYLKGLFQALNPSTVLKAQAELIEAEALQTSAIEGEVLRRSSVQHSILREFGLRHKPQEIRLRENGIVAVLADCFRQYNAPLTHEAICHWHQSLCAYQGAASQLGHYRQSTEPMLILSGSIGREKIIYEAPPSPSIRVEMGHFMRKFHQMHQDPNIGPLERAALAHLHFECIHPFVDGNGRIGRTIVEKSLALSLDTPYFAALSSTIQKDKRSYYQALASCNQSLDANTFLNYFADLILAAQGATRIIFDTVLARTKWFTEFADKLNPRQLKAAKKVWAAEPKGFDGGLSSEKYIAITNASAATATRDLRHLVSIHAFRKTGEKKGTRYWLVRI